MKTKILLLFAILFASVALTSCSSDDDDNSVNNPAYQLLPGTWRCTASTYEWFPTGAGALAGGYTIDSEVGNTITFTTDGMMDDYGAFTGNYTASDGVYSPSGSFVVRNTTEIDIGRSRGSDYSGTYRVTADSLFLSCGTSGATLQTTYVRVR